MITHTFVFDFSKVFIGYYHTLNPYKNRGEEEYFLNRLFHKLIKPKNLPLFIDKAKIDEVTKSQLKLKLEKKSMPCNLT